jgi:5'-nucleotidase
MKVFVDISGSICTGIWPKAPILKAFGAHIFFDDQEKHVLGATTVVPARHVPGPHTPGKPVIPA